MMKKRNGEASKLRREKDLFGIELDSDGEKEIRTDGESLGSEQERINRTVGQARIFSREERKTFGKILEQLQELQREHLGYVEAHGGRLVQRLKENHEHKSLVLAKMSALEEEIIRILDNNLEEQENFPEEE